MNKQPTPSNPNSPNEDEILRRMLNTPPQPKKAPEKKKK
jgi:hypothetical protein